MIILITNKIAAIKAVRTIGQQAIIKAFNFGVQSGIDNIAEGKQIPIDVYAGDFGFGLQETKNLVESLGFFAHESCLNFTFIENRKKVLIEEIQSRNLELQNLNSLPKFNY